MLLHYIVHLPNIEDDISDNTKYIRDEYAWHNEVHVKCVVCAYIYIYVRRKAWICAIRGLRCANCGSLLCAGNPWIALSWCTHTFQLRIFSRKVGWMRCVFRARTWLV